METKVSVEIIKGRYWVKRSMLKTQHRKPITETLSDKTFKQLLLSQHSPIRQYEFWVDIDFTTDRVHTHLVRHRGVEFYVATLREDLIKHLNIDPDVIENNSRSIGFSITAEKLIHMSKLRTCGCAFVDTRDVILDVIEEVIKLDPIFKPFLVPTCVWYGFCPEIKKCGYNKTDKWKSERKELING